LANLRYQGSFEIDRLERILRYTTHQEANIIGESLKQFYKVCEIGGKIELLNFMDSSDNNFNYSFKDFIKKVYADGTKDIVYYGLMAEIINRVYKKNRRI
jgi:hypothetical protein